MSRLSGPEKLREAKSLEFQQMQAYTDATYDYVCYSYPGSALADEAWLIKRVNKTTGTVGFKKDASGLTLAYTLPATNLTVVAAGTYTLGV